MAEHLRIKVRDEHGFSLAELLIVMIITVVIGAAVMSTVAASSRAERQALDMRNNTDHARIAVERIRDVVRGAYGVCNGSGATTVTMWAGDANGNDRIEPEELIRFRFDSGQLLRTNGTGAANVVAFGLGPASAFTYLDRTGAAVASPVTGGLDCASTAVVTGRGNVATIGVALAGDSAPGGRTPATLVESQMTLRNAAVNDGTINPNRPPFAAFTPSCSGRTCNFDASASYDEDGTIAQYHWDFGNGSTAFGRNATHIYTVYGTYEVTLTVTDNAGGTGKVVRFLNVVDGNAPPSAGFTISCSGLLCTFDGTYPNSFDSDGTIVSYQWDFGHPEGSPATGTGASTGYTYPVPGTFPVTLTVTDNGGATDTLVLTANPTRTHDNVKVVLIEDISTSKGGSWIPKVRINLQFADGAPAHGVVVDGKFGPSPEVANDLKSNTTNSLGQVSLQANGDTTNPTFFFQVTKIQDYTIDNGSQTSITLTRP